MNPHDLPREDARGRCSLCGRSGLVLTKHHLIPRTRHKNRRNKKLFDRREVHERLASLCRPCHRHVHVTFDEKQLDRSYNTIEALAAHPEIERFVSWVRKQPPSSHIRSRRASRRG
ncbi:MAG: hypothetical protein JSV80_10560 [Acidobacteriota bacterium]|nr:MAG: hypothetical protein JSV80_10560 [Acidobacteriota bacterium]